MNTKTSWVMLALVIIAIIFSPLIPNDTAADCVGDIDEACDESATYVSIYTRFMQ